MCPVCGFKFLRDDSMNHGICPSCGTQFGYDDVSISHEALRSAWLNDGAQWFDTSMRPPANWDGWMQAMEAFYPPQITPSRKPSRSEVCTNFKLEINSSVHAT